MKPHFKFFIALSAAILTASLISPGLVAQSAARVTVPFAFSANDRVLPAGSYRVELLTEDLLAFENWNTGKVEVALKVRTSDASRPILESVLVFSTGTGRNRLTEVRFSRSSMQSELAVQPSLTRELGKNKKNQTLEIAMNEPNK